MIPIVFTHGYVASRQAISIASISGHAGEDEATTAATLYITKYDARFKFAIFNINPEEPIAETMDGVPAGFDEYSRVVGRQRAQPSHQGPSEPHIGKETNGRFFDVTEYWTSETEPGECVPTGQAPNARALSKGQYGDNSLLLRRINIPDKPSRLQLEIQSAGLQEKFRNATGDLPSINVQANPIVIPAPFRELYFFREELREARLEPSIQGTPLQADLQLLQDFEDEHVSPLISLEEIEASKENGIISLEHLWALFKPRELVVLQTKTAASESVRFCAVVQKYWVDKDNENWYIIVRHMSFEGSRFGYVEREFKFQCFPGVRDIESLPTFPLAYFGDEAGLRISLEARGNKFVSLCKGGMDGSATGRGVLGDYKGPVWLQREEYKIDGTDFFDAPEEFIEGRVLADPGGFNTDNPLLREAVISKPLYHKPGTNTSSNIDEAIIIDVDNLETDDLVCFPARIGGYSLATKHTGFFLVSGFRDAEWDTEEAEKVLSSSNKMQTVRSIVSGFSQTSRSFGYSLKTKGKGLVFLFYGPSGTGKTLTAECLAECFRRPLYRVSGADLGSYMWEIERNLQAAFRRVARWKAILLLDEADGFMAERSDESSDRNNLVSILLRLLEYQTGIVVLTTNRESEFDKAFHTRIHVSLNFAAITPAEREVIWRRKVCANRTQLGSSSLSDGDFADLSKLSVDGRTIQNVVHVAKLYASARGNSVDNLALKDLKDVLQISISNMSTELEQQIVAFCKNRADSIEI